MATVPIEHHAASAGELHDLDPFGGGLPESPLLWRCDVTRPAVVLGSRQSTELVDRDACAAAGIDIVRRRSGGGAVLLGPGSQIWIDVIIPARALAPRGPVPDDVRGSMIWVGDVWRDAIAGLGADADRLTTHRGAMVCTPWSDLVCFAGVGPGELVVDDGAKLLGLSQRRTRHGLRVQCQVYRERMTAELSRLFAVATPDAALAEPATLSEVVDAAADDSAVADAVAAALARRIPTL